MQEWVFRCMSMLYVYIEDGFKIYSFVRMYVFSYANVRMYLVIHYIILYYVCMYVCVGPLCKPGLHKLLHCHESARFLQPPLRNSRPRHRPARSGYHLS